MLIIFIVLSSLGSALPPTYAQFSYQSPARADSDEAKAQSPKQFLSTRARQQSLVKKQQFLINTEEIQKEISKASRQMSESLEIEQKRQEIAKQNIADLAEQASQKAQGAWAQTVVGFEYFLEKNFDGSLAKALLLDGLVARVEGEAVKNDFGTVSRQNRDIIYYGRGKYYRLPKSERVELTTNTGENVIVEVSETTFEQYHGDPKWWADKYSKHYAFPKAYTTVSTSSLTPYKIDTVRISDATPQVNLENGQWRRESWIEETESTDEPGVIYKRQVFMAGYDDHENLLTFFSISWSPKASLELVFTTYKAEYLKLPDGREKVEMEEVRKTEIPAPSDPKLMAILDSVLAEELIPFELVQYAYGIAIE